MKPNIVTIALLGVLIYTCFAWYSAVRETTHLSQQLDALATASANLNYIEKYYRDTVEHTVYRDKLVPDNKAAKLLALSKGRTDSLEQALRIAIDKIDSYTRISASVRDKVTLKPTADSPVQYLTYSDKWLHLKLYPESSLLDFKYNIDLNIARYHKKQWLLGDEQHYLDLWGDDPRVTINGLQRFQVQERRQKRFGFGVNAGYGFTAGGERMPYIGVGFNYNLLEF